jgi:hypothetical protein
MTGTTRWRWVVKRRRLYYYAAFTWLNLQTEALKFRLKRSAAAVAGEYEGARVVELKPKAR